MDFRRSASSTIVLLVVLIGSVAGSAFISDNVLESHGFAGRSLLQARTSCPIDFENMNYTILTSRCKGPQYPANLCCPALKEFACPFADQVNDDTTDCASTMFSYINLYGRYPPGLFSSECREGKEGLACPVESGASAASACNFTLFMLLVCGALVPFLFG